VLYGTKAVTMSMTRSCSAASRQTSFGGDPADVTRGQTAIAPCDRLEALGLVPFICTMAVLPRRMRWRSIGHRRKAARETSRRGSRSCRTSPISTDLDHAEARAPRSRLGAATGGGLPAMQVGLLPGIEDDDRQASLRSALQGSTSKSRERRPGAAVRGCAAANQRIGARSPIHRHSRGRAGTPPTAFGLIDVETALSAKSRL